jgi:predicted transcriptional regulator of viral defense system
MNSQYNKKMQAGIGKTERHVIDTLTLQGKISVNASDLEKEFGYERKAANLVLSRLSRKGWVQRLKAGVYRIVPLGSDTAEPVPADAWAIGMELFSPCYISGWSAAEHWDLTEQIFNSTAIFTSQKKRKKDFVIAGLRYRIKFIEAENFFGLKQIWSSNKAMQIADIHRTIIDILDDPAIGGGGRHAFDITKSYWQKNESDPDILYQYAEKLNHPAVVKRLGFIAERVGKLPDSWTSKLQSKIKTGIIKLDPHGPNSGPIVSKWGLRINIPLEDIP